MTRYKKTNILSPKRRRKQTSPCNISVSGAGWLLTQLEEVPSLTSVTPKLCTRVPQGRTCCSGSDALLKVRVTTQSGTRVRLWYNNYYSQWSDTTSVQQWC
ncbi:hypothetical protein OTU49_016280 [Cherax quadricarinatus]|uniref:Uncharacterized protein n=1 Tax=Cherax quadricarinatus TaxID=27406 RepID=A0AAW0Y801_CHEQU